MIQALILLALFAGAGTVLWMTRHVITPIEPQRLRPERCWPQWLAPAVIARGQDRAVLAAPGSRQSLTAPVSSLSLGGARGSDPCVPTAWRPHHSSHERLPTLLAMRHGVGRTHRPASAPAMGKASTALAACRMH